MSMSTAAISPMYNSSGVRVAPLTEHEAAMAADAAAHPGATWAESYRRVRDAKKAAPHWRWPTLNEILDAEDNETE